ncbi:MAG: hypothetical protein COW18_02300 [Zetaproteobacteria bacterium CG12_big_fil_rev_8_21_14_0_65_54_13]|nr:MAG: hypothetical protein COW18_02300 [Zetaproteobacteria bacterium CG12_big_fil_rev_8_21_14_0_65_54_13]PIX54744.1 MAG: hypothetical protein COZ50_06360 [Zetaproteobacteria bacterium CG_4_10_14_3_um_filter_54_28]PJA30230.1 MAG: hypothetical protein CO188_04625 [Zetaproteobacteria bacterium CG_4_9_14_3_um_filter_54_145]
MTRDYLMYVPLVLFVVINLIFMVFPISATPLYDAIRSMLISSTGLGFVISQLILLIMVAFPIYRKLFFGPMFFTVLCIYCLINSELIFSMWMFAEFMGVSFNSTLSAYTILSVFLLTKTLIVVRHSRTEVTLILLSTFMSSMIAGYLLALQASG